MDENQLQNNNAESGMEKNRTRDTERDNTTKEQEGGTVHEASVKAAESSNLPPIRNVPPVATAYRTEKVLFRWNNLTAHRLAFPGLPGFPHHPRTLYPLGIYHDLPLGSKSYLYRRKKTPF